MNGLVKRGWLVLGMEATLAGGRSSDFNRSRRSMEAVHATLLAKCNNTKEDPLLPRLGKRGRLCRQRAGRRVALMGWNGRVYAMYGVAR